MYFNILNGKYKNRRINLKTGSNIIGRSPESDIVIGGDGCISKTHIKLSYSDNGKISVEDLNSRNGTFLNNKPILNSTEVRVGDVIRIGNTYLKISELTQTSVTEQKNAKDTHNILMEAFVFIEIVGVTVKIVTGEDRVVLKHKKNLINCLMRYLKERKPEYMKNMDNGFLIIFRSIESALGFACDFLKELTGNTDEYYKNAIMSGLHLQLGIHYGKSKKLPNGERIGSGVERALRLSSVTPDDKHKTIMGGITKNLVPQVDRIFISEEVFQMVSNETDYEMQFIGYFDFEGFEKSQKVYEIVI